MTHANTSQLKRAFKDFERSKIWHLSHCYNNYSTAKARAYEYCLELVRKYQGFYSYRIISYNSNIFTFGFIGEINGKQAFFYITRDYDRFIYLDEIEG